MTITATPNGVSIPGYGTASRPSMAKVDASTIRFMFGHRRFTLPVLDIDGVNSTVYTGDQTADDVIADILTGLTTAPGSPYTLTLTYTPGNAPSQTLGQWNTQLGGNFTGVSVVGDSVLLTGGSNVTIPPQALQNENDLRVLSDDGSIIEIRSEAFQSSGITSLTATGCGAIGSFLFVDCHGLTYVELPVCTDFGGTTGPDGVFDNIIGNTMTIIVPTSLATCNGGSEDGDLADVQVLNTVTINYV